MCVGVPSMQGISVKTPFVSSGVQPVSYGVRGGGGTCTDVYYKARWIRLSKNCCIVIFIASRECRGGAGEWNASVTSRSDR